MEETWKEIDVNFGAYEVSNLGHVRNKETNKTLKPVHCKDGYLKVNLRCGPEKTVTVHRLVAMAFCQNPANKPQVNHMDCNKENNSASNLEWVTPLENTHHAIANGRFDPMAIAKYHPSKNPNPPKIILHTFNNKTTVYPSFHAASRETGISTCKIWRSLTGRAKSDKYGVWKYADPQ